MHFTKQIAIGLPQLGLSNGIPCILSAQGAVKPRDVGVEGKENHCSRVAHLT